MKTVNELIKDINSLTSHLHEKDFLLTWEQTPDELKQVLDVAAALKALRAENISTKVFNSGLGISVFRDNSTRTRFSYASALNLLGLAQQDLDEGKSQIAHHLYAAGRDGQPGAAWVVGRNADILRQNAL